MPNFCVKVHHLGQDLRHRLGCVRLLSVVGASAPLPAAVPACIGHVRWSAGLSGNPHTSYTYPCQSRSRPGLSAVVMQVVGRAAYASHSLASLAVGSPEQRPPGAHRSYMCVVAGTHTTPCRNTHNTPVCSRCACTVQGKPSGACLQGARELSSILCSLALRHHWCLGVIRHVLWAWLLA